MPRAEADLRWHTGLLTATFPLGPFFGQVETDIDQGVFAARDVAEVDADLAVLDLAQAATPLARDTNGGSALLGSHGVCGSV